MFCIYIKVYGRVQKVMYRDYIKRYARSIGARGYVKNLKDGTVEIVACINRKDLEKFLKRVQSGTIFARVDSFELQSCKTSCEQLPEKFMIKY